MNDQEFNQLLESLLDGEPRDFAPESLNLEQRQELIEFLNIEPHLRDAFSKPGAFAAGVMKVLECDDSTDRQQFREAVLRGNRRRRGISQAALWRALPWGIAAVLLILLAGASLRDPANPGADRAAYSDSADNIIPTSPTSPAAILVAEAKAEFDPAHAPNGVRCEPGQYVLRSGSIHLRLLNGVDLAMKGPARFVIHSPFELDLEQGICRAAVPESGHGFTINTAEMEVIDLGTEFGVSVDPQGRASEVRVFEGEVDVVATNSTQKTRLEMYDTLRISSSEGVTRARIRAEDFPDIRSIGFTRWQQWHQKITQDPDIIAYLPMQKRGKQLELISALPEAPAAQLKGARRVIGRWPGKGALLFDQDGDGVELDLGTEHEELTIAMWVKADRWDYPITALANSNGWGPGALHLQTSRGANARVHGSIRLGDVEHSVRSYSSGSMQPGRWHHVAYVLSKRTGKFQSFLDGVAGPAREIPENSPLNPGMIRLGDWDWQSAPNSSMPQWKGFRGRIDEFIALSRALSQDEIDEMVVNGRPSFLWPD
ncbi:MAG: FecR domain-containing protein [Akkermansiaceae bacterium]|nr:FecR domain-containing protein [Akkermansiaceae bacterium]